jgi:hypothetical protein
MRRSTLFSILLLLFISNLSLSQPNEPFEPDETTLGLWHMENVNPQFENAILFDDEASQWFRSAIRTRDGNFLAVGAVQIGNITRSLLMKINPEGEVIWTRNYIYSDRADEQVCDDVAEFENGNIVMVGLAYSNDFRFSASWLIIVDSEGEEISSTELSNNIENSCSTVMVDNEDSIVLGYSRIMNSSQIRKYTRDVELVWTFNASNASGGPDREIIQTSDGGYFGVGWEYVARNSYGCMSKVNINGELEWERRYGLAGTMSILRSMVEVENGYICVGSNSPQNYENREDTDIWLLSVNEDGEVINEVTIDREIFGRCKGYDIAQCNDGNFIISGLIYDENSSRQNGVPLLKVNRNLEVISSDSFSEADYSAVIRIFCNPDSTYTLFGDLRHYENDNNIRRGLMLTTTTDYPWSTDFSGNGNDLRPEGDADLCEGIWGEALDLSNRNGGMALVSDNETLKPEQFRIEAWFNMDEEIPHTGVIVSKLIQEEFTSFQLYADNDEGYIGFAVRNENGEEFLEYDVDPADGRWHYIAGDYDGEQMRLVWENSFVDSLSVAGPIIYGDGPLVIGSNSDLPLSDLQFYGQIDEVMLSNSPLEGVSVPRERRILSPGESVISGVYPNPFNSEAAIEYSLSYSGNYTLTVNDLTGREVARIFQGWKNSGEYKTVWDAKDFGSGTYLIRLGGVSDRSMKVVNLVK